MRDDVERVAKTALASLERDGVLRRVRTAGGAIDGRFEVSPPRGRECRGWVHAETKDRLRAEIAARRDWMASEVPGQKSAEDEQALRTEAERAVLARLELEVVAEMARLRASSAAPDSC